ncbi:MAG: double-strand break repair helicase AddA [Devosiaceae bacterium]|nr:double-strand break repair helicase AddA [Devosiaceae bacterium]
MISKPEIFASPDIVNNQLRAGNPEHSVWVAANAGSGKTYILTKRVLRLLLSGVAPQNILCLTYTKAAAAEMKSRIGGDLSKWVLFDDEELKNELEIITGKTPSADKITQARTLFALALETPGGLKVSTIHGFCEAALHRFPLEADVPVNFSVIEENERKNLIERASKRVLAGGLGGDLGTAKAVADLFMHMGDDAIAKAIGFALGKGRNLRTVLADVDAAKNNLRQFLNVKSKRTLEQVNREIVTSTLLDESSFNSVIELLEHSSPEAKSLRFVNLLAKMDFGALSSDGLQAAFLTNKGTPRKNLMLAKEKSEHKQLLSLLQAEQGRIFELSLETIKISLIERSEALLDVLAKIWKSYEQAKQSMEVLDFDDLVTRFELLLSKGNSADWVRYKMDAGMTHILVDESQDTNPDQWRVVRLLVEEFFDGESSNTKIRTIFGVGDEKQSIFGFQGAEPKLFAQTGKELKFKAIRAEKTFEEISFLASFRTLPNILEAVDMLCQRPDIASALLAHDCKVTHESARADKGGSIVFWPPPEVEKSISTDREWLRDPAKSLQSKERQTAERIGEQIKHWLDSKRGLGARARAVCADDILILVQSRGPVFHEIIRSLKSRNIPTPGADRLIVNSHIVVQDLKALGEILLNPNDDLTLAALLRSPLFKFSEDQLERICMGRKKNISVWKSLGVTAKTQTHDWAAIAYDELRDMRSRLDFERPYEFYADVLFARQGMKKFHSRLGEEIDEVIVAFLDLALEHENSSQPSLQGFLHMLGEQQIEIKRELNEVGGGVRVMSVHGAKGLEAPIVILADATSKPRFRDTVFFSDGDEPMLVHGSKEQHTKETLEHFRQKKVDEELAEYWRKLYVAMTRAEDELYVTGSLEISSDDVKNPGNQQNWYGAILDALEGKTGAKDIFNEEEKAICFPANSNLLLAIVKTEQSIDEVLELPKFKILPLKVAAQIIRPSNVDDNLLPKEMLEKDDVFQTGSEKISQSFGIENAENVRKKGLALHSLLQYLAPIEPGNREETGYFSLKKILSDQPEDHQMLVEKAIAILNGEDAKKLFGKNSRAELPIFAHGEKDGAPITIIGRIDRTIVENSSVLLVDFKSGSNVPTSPEQTAQQYLVQMGLYLRCGKKIFGNHKVSTAIYWTKTQTLMPLKNNLILEATIGFNIT